MTRGRELLVALLLAVPAPAAAQSVQAEVAVTAGSSSQDVTAIATQFRLYGEPRRNVRYFVEAAWAKQFAEESDAFASAYPYEDVKAIETYGEAFVPHDTMLLGIRAGRYRTPFGLYTRSDHAYAGFTRPPLIRYDDYFGLSNNFLEGGVNILAGVPALHTELSLGVPQDVGQAVRRKGFDPVIRIEGYHRGLVVGASHIRSRPYDRRAFVTGNMTFDGVDFRYMNSGIQLRGEWVTGKPFGTVSTRGWYLDASAHHRVMGPITALVRTEELYYKAGRFSRYDKRVTVGALLRLPQYLVAQLNLVHQPTTFFNDTRATAFDASLTWVVRVPQ